MPARTWRIAGVSPDCPSEVPVVGETAADSHVGQGHLIVGQLLQGLVDPQHGAISMSTIGSFADSVVFGWRRR
jgi:hypothetical protein